MLMRLKNNLNEISHMCDDIEQFCQDNAIPQAKTHDILLIIDELVTNVINYAYPQDEEHEFFLYMDKVDDLVHIKIVDSGIAFDPLAKTDPNTALSLEERQIGGLGIFLVKRLSEEVKYSRIDDKNQLYIKVSLSLTDMEENDGN